MAKQDRGLTKHCPRCGVLKPIIAFGWVNKRLGKREGWCRGCRAVWQKAYRSTEVARQKMRAYMRKRYRANPAPVLLANKREKLKKKYGLSFEQLQGMYQTQQYSCAICREEEWFIGKLHIDHCHSTGKVRALLCGPCNLALGLVKENIVVLQAMTTYLRAHQ